MESFDLNEHNTLTFAENSEEAVLSAVFHKRAEIGFLMAETYDNLSDFGKRLFRPIIRSQIDIIIIRVQNLRIGAEITEKTDPSAWIPELYC